MFHQTSGWWFILNQQNLFTPSSTPIQTEDLFNILTEDDQDILTE